MSNDEPGFADRLGDILNTPTPLPSNALTVTLGALALAAGISGVWLRYATVLNTLFHEAGHALGALITGGGVHLIRIDTHESGLTYSWYRTRFSDIVSSFAGASAPPLAAIGIAYLVREQKAATALLIIALVAAAVLLVARDLLTVVVTVAIAVGAGGLVWWANATTHTVVAVAVAWLFLICEATHLLKEMGNRYLAGIDTGGETDAECLWDSTVIFPPIVWYAAWLALNGWCLWVAVPMLWH
jgi:hypothetical protein